MKKSKTVFLAVMVFVPAIAIYLLPQGCAKETNDGAFSASGGMASSVPMVPAPTSLVKEKPPSPQPTGDSTKAATFEPTQDCRTMCVRFHECKIVPAWKINDCVQFCGISSGSEKTQYDCLKGATSCGAMKTCWGKDLRNWRRENTRAVTLAVEKTLIGSFDDENVPAVVIWEHGGQRIELAVEHSEGEGGRLVASSAGSTQTLGAFDLNLARTCALAWRLEADGTVLFTINSGAGSQDEGGATALRLRLGATDKKVRVDKRWDGSDLEKVPPWAAVIDLK